MENKEVVKVVFVLSIKDNNYLLINETTHTSLDLALEIVRQKLGTNLQNRILLEKQTHYSTALDNHVSEVILSYRHDKLKNKHDKVSSIHHISLEQLSAFKHPKLSNVTETHKEIKRKRLIYALSYYKSIGLTDLEIVGKLKVHLITIRTYISDYNITETTFTECTNGNN